MHIVYAGTRKIRFRKSFELRHDRKSFSSYRRRRLLQTLEEIDDLRLLLDVLHLLDDIKTCGSGSTDVDCDGLHKGTASKRLDLLGHRGTKEQRLSLRLMGGGGGRGRERGGIVTFKEWERKGEGRGRREREEGLQQSKSGKEREEEEEEEGGGGGEEGL